MAASNDEWELSKENIQPLQQGRKPEVLKVALSSDPEDLILQQRQAFENELRTYTGDDPLSLWCKYIKWVEQNYPKGGKDGHIEQLIEKCLSILKDKSEYYDDKRFIEIWLKFANMVTKPNEIFQYMYSNKIGCKSATFFAAWSWELESQGNISKADQVLTEGIRRKAEPFEKLKSYRSEFEMRVASNVMVNSKEIHSGDEPSRAAFAVLKPVKKKSVAPVVRVGDRVVDPSKVSMTIGRQQPLPKSNLPSGKVPFKIYSGENIQHSLPVQSDNIAPFILHSDISKENEKKPSKWNKVKLKQTPSLSRTSQNAPSGFKLHCDESSPSQDTPRSVPKVSNILRVRKEPAAPQLALFEPLDPMKKPMYDKEKVYGGAEEFSLEEIRAAEWFKKKKELEKERQLAEQERLLLEQQEQINKLMQEVQILKTKQYSSNDSNNITENKNMDRSCSKNASCHSQLSFSQKDKSSVEKSQDTNTSSIQKELFPNSKLTSTFRDVSCIVREFYNNTISHPSDDTSIHLENSRKLNPPQFKASAFQNPKSFEYQDPVTLAKTDISSKENASSEQLKSVDSSKPALAFKLFQDPTEIISQSKDISVLQKVSAMNNCLKDEKQDIENIPPKGYIQEITKRELSGILQPSKNIMFIPLKEQELSDEEDDIPRELYQENNNHPLQDETLIPPCNTEQFLAASFLASTPRTHSKIEQKISPQNGISPKSVQSSDEICNLPPMQNTLENAICSREASKTDYKSSVKDQSTFRAGVGQLSVIMESSREIYKSSSSSGSSASATRLSHFEQCFSQEKSNYQKHFSRTDKFKEPRPVVQGSELPHYSADRENTFGVFKEPKPISQNIEVSDLIKEGTNSVIPVACHSEETFKKPVVKTLDDTHNNQDECKQLDAEIKEIHCTDIDPFDEDFNAKIIESMPVENRSIFYTSEKIHQLEINDKIQVGDLICEVENQISEGAFGKVYEAKIKNTSNKMFISNSKVALKFFKKSNFWELYICNIMHKRLADLKKIPDVQSSVMEIISAHQYINTLILTSEFSQRGTLLDLVNYYKKQNLCVPECITMYLTLEMLHIMSQIHECQIIHGDIKPDNILLRDISSIDIMENLSKKIVLLKFIDFGRGIDLKVFKRGVCFKTVLKDACIEMKEKKPWVFQIDWYGICNCIHVLLFQEYMKVKKGPNGRWRIEKNIKRYWDHTLWFGLFDELLNIPACYQEPDIFKYTSLIESKLKTNQQMFKIYFQRLLNSLVRK